MFTVWFSRLKVLVQGIDRFGENGNVVPPAGIVEKISTATSSTQIIIIIAMDRLSENHLLWKTNWVTLKHRHAAMIVSNCSDTHVKARNTNP